MLTVRQAKRFLGKEVRVKWWDVGCDVSVPLAATEEEARGLLRLRTKRGILLVAGNTIAMGDDEFLIDGRLHGDCQAIPLVLVHSIQGMMIQGKPETSERKRGK